MKLQYISRQRRKVIKLASVSITILNSVKIAFTSKRTHVVVTIQFSK